MKIVNMGYNYQIYDDGMKLYDQLPAQVYSISFNQMSGFKLVKHDDLEINENKIYGTHLTKVDKVLKTFEAFERSLGIILSGEKGIGKSIFAKLVSNKAIEKGYPVIIVSEYIPGIASFIEGIQQEVVILFDEFDKTFVNSNNNENPQTELLSLFDGISAGKKMFIVTCNYLGNLNDFLVNRPGRFHYHFRFTYPDANEIKEYMQDKLEKKYWKEIDNIIPFSYKVPLNYDCLRSIAFEINLGYTFKEAIKDLNIINFERNYYDLSAEANVIFKDGRIEKQTFTESGVTLDLFSTSSDWFDIFNDNMEITIKFFSREAKFDMKNKCYILDGKNINVTDFCDRYEGSGFCENVQEIKVSSLQIKRTSFYQYDFDF